MSKFFLHKGKIAMKLTPGPNLYALAGLLIMTYADYGLAAVGKVLVIYSIFDLLITLAVMLKNKGK